MLARGVGPLREGGEGGQFLNQRVRRGLQPERNGGRKEGVLIQVGQSRIHRVRVFGSRALSWVVRMRRWLRLGRGGW